MAHLLRGTYMNNCHCLDICPCNVDLKPNGPGGECKGWMVLNIREGNRDKVDLTGVNVAMVYTIPDKPSSGNWRIGLVVDKKASDEQAAATETILTGKDGGLFEAFSALFSQYMGLKRAAVAFKDGETPNASVEGAGKLAFEPFRDGEGNSTKLVNAAFGMTPEFVIGRSSGKVNAFGLSFDSSWGELGEFEFAS